KIEKLKATLHFADTTVAKNTHTIFVDTEEEAKNFDPVRYFNTPKEVLDRRYNRPRISTLQSSTIINAKRKSDVKEADHERRKMYSELLKRLQRAKELKVVVEKLEVKRNVVESKGKELRPKKKIEKLKATLHFADTTVAKNTHTIFVDTEEEGFIILFSKSFEKYL
ncbi:hypothetical protein WUBG_15235, partial [Wuchereria bancrofti]